MAALRSSLIVSMIDRVTKPAGRISNALGRITGVGTGNLGLIGGGLGRIAAAVGGIYAVQRAVTGSISAAMDFESAMADVAKVVDFPTPAAFKQFQANVIDMSKHLPMAADDLSRIVAAAGQAGIANADLLKFTELAAKVGVAFDISADTAGDSLAKMMTALNMSVDDVGKLADAMNHLSNSQASSASGILEFFRRTGADGKMFGFTAEQTAAFGSAMLAAGAEAEVAATSFRNMGKALGKGGAATKAQRSAFRALGLNAKTTAKMMQKDAVGTTLKVLEAINKLPKHQQAAVASQLFGDEARALMPLITNLDLLKKSLGMVSNESQYLGSASREYERRAKTFANDVQLFKNNLTALEIAVGNRLMPILSRAMDGVTPFINALTGAFNTLDQRVSIFDKVGAAIDGFLTGLGFAGDAKLAQLFNGGIDLIFGKLGTFEEDVTQLSASFEEFRKMGAAINEFATAHPVLVDTLGTLAGYGAELFVAAAGISMAAGVVKMIGNVLLTLTGVKTAAGILRAVAGLGRAAPGLGAAATAMGSIATALGAISKAGAAAVILRPFFEMGMNFGKLFGGRTPEQEAANEAGVQSALKDYHKRWGANGSPADQFIKNLFGGKSGAGASQRAALDDATKEWPEAARMGMDAYVEALQVGGGVAENYATTLAEDIKRQLAVEGRVDIDTVALERALSLARQLAAVTGGTPAPVTTAVPIAGARAAGGPVDFGKIYMVGERGPELFTPGADGHISPNSVYRQAAGGGGRSIHIGGITIHMGMVSDGRSMRDVAEDLGWRIRDALDGAFADGTV